MARFLLAKMASVAALISTSVDVERLSDSHYKPIICNPGTMLKDGRCVNVAKAKAPKARTPKSSSNY